MKAIEIATHPLGLHFSKNKITVSTVGLVPQIKRFVRDCDAQLAVSLHATNDAVRDSIVPVNRRYNLSQLMACLRCALVSFCAAACRPCDVPGVSKARAELKGT